MILFETLNLLLPIFRYIEIPLRKLSVDYNCVQNLVIILITKLEQNEFHLRPPDQIQARFHHEFLPACVFDFVIIFNAAL